MNVEGIVLNMGAALFVWNWINHCISHNFCFLSRKSIFYWEVENIALESASGIQFLVSSSM